MRRELPPEDRREDTSIPARRTTVRLLFLCLSLASTWSSCKPAEPEPTPEEPPHETELPVVARTGVITGRVLTKEGEGFAGIELIAEATGSERAVVSGELGCLPGPPGHDRRF